MTVDSPLRSRRILLFWVIAVALQVTIVVAVISYPGAFGFQGKSMVHGDMPTYFKHAVPVLEGRMPYRDYLVEYPILAMPFFIAPLLAGRSFEAYKVGFVVEMLLANGWIVLLVARQVARSEGVAEVRPRLAWYTVYFATFCPLIVARFDLVPTLLAFWVVQLLVAGRFLGGGIAAGLGVLLKLVPGLVLLPLMVQKGSWRPKALAMSACVATIAAGGLAWWALGGERLIESLRYHSDRGLEIGSLYSSAYLVAHKLAGVRVFTYVGFGSVNLGGPGAGWVASLSPLVQVGLLLLVAVRSRQAGTGPSFRLASAALLAYVIGGKVLSPQYLVWLLPFLCVLPGRNGKLARWLFLACCLLTTMIFPHQFYNLSVFKPLAVFLLASRNLGLLALLAILLQREPISTPT